MALTPWAIGVVMSLAGQTVDAAAQAAPPGQGAPTVEKCLHGASESADDRARRQEALAAMRMIDWVASTQPTLYPPGVTWAQLADFAAVKKLQGMDGPVGDLARRLGWGAPEPLPGWAMEWRIAPALPRLPPMPLLAFALTDLRDPCKFSYSSADRDVMRAWRPELRLLQPPTY